MTPTDPRWPQFASRLTRALATPAAIERCDRAEVELEAAETAQAWSAIDGCASSHGEAPPHATSRAVLASMGGYDLDASVEYFKTHAGHCDCEVLLNLEAAV